MNIYSKFNNIAERTKKTKLIYGAPQFGSRNNWNSAISLPTVYRCVDFLSNAVAGLPLRPFTSEGMIDINSELYKLLKVSPNEFMSAYTFKRMIVQSMLLKGNAFVLINRKGNKIESLEYIDPARVTCNCYEEQAVRIGVANYIIDGKEYDPKDILHFINYSTDGIWGKSTLEVIRDTIDLSGNQLSTSSEIFKNKLFTRGLLTSPGKVVQNEKEVIKESWANQTGIPVLDSGLTYQAITISPVDAQLIEGQKYTDELILAAFGLKLSNLFNISGPYGSIEQNQIDFLNNTLNPLLQKIENEFERKLGVEVNFDVNQLLRSDRSSLVNQGAIMLQNGAITAAEYRATLGFEPNPEITNTTNYDNTENTTI